MTSSASLVNVSSLILNAPHDGSVACVSFTMHFCSCCYNNCPVINIQ
jgi:hypothetical protein